MRKKERIETQKFIFFLKFYILYYLSIKLLIFWAILIRDFVIILDFEK